MSLDYVKDPEEIYRRSFAQVRAEARLERVPPDLEPVAVRLVHACGMPDIVDVLDWSPGVAGAVSTALAAGADLLVDARMVEHGIIRAHLPAANRVRCAVDTPSARSLAATDATTRSAAAVELWRPYLGGAIVVIGNAPTALFRLLEILQDPDQPRPAAVLAFPVGFVGAAESKAALVRLLTDVPYLTVHGRRGGSALAAAAVNALAGAP